jgi:hypothetical protein
MNTVRERDRLNRLVTHARVLRRKVIPNAGYRSTTEQQHEKNCHRRQPVRPLRKNIGHVSKSFSDGHWLFGSWGTKKPGKANDRAKE